MKKLLILLLSAVLVVSLVLIGVGCKEEVAEEAPAEEKAPAEEEVAEEAPAEEGEAEVVAEEVFKFTVVVHSSESPYWNPVKKGCEDAANLFGVEVDFTGVTGIDHTGQVAILESLIATGSDGIATTITDPLAYNDIIKKGIDAGLPVVAMNTQGAEVNPAMAFIGFDYYLHGKIEGEQAAKLIGDNKGLVLNVTGEPGHSGVQLRMKGFKDYLEPLGYTVDQLDVTGDLPTAVDAITNYYNSHKDVLGIFGAGAADTAAIGIAIKKLDLAGKLFGGGFDTTSETLDNIKQGYTQFTLDANAYLQGYYCVMDLAIYKQLDFPCANIDTGAYIVNSENIDKFIEAAELGYR